MWVEFLLTQADGAPPASPASGGGSLPPLSPTRSQYGSLGVAAAAEPRKSGSWIRLPSFGGAVATREEEAPPPPLPPLPKGKEREGP
jgi:hypothetical protein